MFLSVARYNCNRYDEDEAKKARDAQEVTVVSSRVMSVVYLT